jgi:hypothetical protein
MSVTITIKTASVVSDIKIKSQLNTDRIKDADDRYAVRAGEENDDEVMECLQEAWRAAKALCREFLASTDDTAGNDTFSDSTADKTLTFDVTSRRTSNIGEPLAQAIHNYIVAGTLRRFYVTVAMPDLVTLYSQLEATAASDITYLLRRKQQPVYTA